MRDILNTIAEGATVYDTVLEAQLAERAASDASVSAATNLEDAMRTNTEIVNNILVFMRGAELTGRGNDDLNSLKDEIDKLASSTVEVVKVSRIWEQSDLIEIRAKASLNATFNSPFTVH